MPLRQMILLKTIGIDLIYSFVIVFASLLIYFATKELYELSNHKGIKYFRYSFIFFALAYAFRFLAQWLFVVLGLPRTLQIHPGVFGLISLMLFMYASTTAIFYLWASVHWRKIEKKQWSMPALHALAITLGMVSIIINNFLFLLIVQLAIIVVLAVTIYNRDKKHKKKTQQLYLIYGLLAVFWMLNILDILIPNAFQTIQLLIYLISISLFMLMLYKVVRKTGAR